MNLPKNSVKNKIIWCLTLVVCLAGCGLKADPVPVASQLAPSKAQLELSASVESGAVVLIWRLQNPEGEIRHIHLEKSDLGEADKVCSRCPRAYVRIGRISVVDPYQERYQFSDTEVVKGRRYDYRITLCNENGVCRLSKTEEINVK